MARFVLRSKQNCEVFDGTNLAAVEGVVVYRITLDLAVDAELKIITDGVAPKILTANSLNKSIDIAVRKHLFIEATGANGVVVGSFDILVGV